MHRLATQQAGDRLGLIKQINDFFLKKNQFKMMAALEAYGGERLGNRPRLELLGALRMRSADSKRRFPRPQRRLPSSSKRRPCPVPHVHSVTSQGVIRPPDLSQHMQRRHLSTFTCWERRW